MELNKLGEGDSTSGSDSAPSDDNLSLSELTKQLPAEEAKKLAKKKPIVKQNPGSPSKRPPTPKTQPFDQFKAIIKPTVPT